MSFGDRILNHWSGSDIWLHNVNLNYSLKETNFMNSESLQVYIFFKYLSPFSNITILLANFVYRNVKFFFNLTPKIEII